MQQRFNQIIWGLNFISLVSFFIIVAQYVLSLLGQWGSNQFFQRSDMQLLRGRILEDAFQIGLICFGAILLGVYFYTLKMTKKLKIEGQELLDEPFKLIEEKQQMEQDFLDKKNELLNEISSLHTTIQELTKLNTEKQKSLQNYLSEVRTISHHFNGINLHMELNPSNSSIWDENEVNNQLFLMETLIDRVTSISDTQSELELLSFNLNVELFEDPALSTQSNHYGNQISTMKKMIESNNKLIEHTKKLLIKNSDYLKDLVEHMGEANSKASAMQEQKNQDISQRLTALTTLRDKLHLLLDPDGLNLTQGIMQQNSQALESQMGPLFS